MKKRSIWDILVWVAIAIFILWAILKVVGIIGSPIIVEIVPYMTAAYVMGRLFQKLETTVDDVKIIKDEVKEIDKRLQTLEIKDSVKAKK